MGEPSEFEREYFLQTRREIDSEKRERDQVLNFAVIVLGALAFAVVQSEKAMDFLKEPYSLVMEGATLAVLTSLFWVRRKKLQQIADRWYTTYHLLGRHYPPEQVAQSMEAVVMHGFQQARYIKKDVVLNVALSSPIYGLVFFSAVQVSAYRRVGVILATALVGIHLALSYWFLGSRFKDPFPVVLPGPIEEGVEQASPADRQQPAGDGRRR